VHRPSPSYRSVEYRDHRGWAFTGGDFADDANGFSFLSEAYETTRRGYDARVSVPVLWDKDTPRSTFWHRTAAAELSRAVRASGGDAEARNACGRPLRRRARSLASREGERVRRGS
jgi:hypothetical protein